MCIYYDKLDKVFYLLKNLSEFKWDGLHLESLGFFWSCIKLKDESGQMHSDFPGLV